MKKAKKMTPVRLACGHDIIDPVPIPHSNKTGGFCYQCKAWVAITPIPKKTDAHDDKVLANIAKTEKAAQALRIPKDFPVQPLKPGQEAKDRATCGGCGLSWDDAIPTSMTPAPSGRCPFETFHPDPTESITGQHTPGPWYTMARGNHYQSEIVQEGTGTTIAVTYTSNDADAVLIATAPELLAACYDMLMAFDSPAYQDQFGIGTAEDRAIVKAREAVYKAKTPQS